MKRLDLLSQNDLIEYTMKLESAMKEFVDRCEKGEVRSNRTYKQFIGLLNLPDYTEE